jgi:hypothetical protein
MMRYNTPFQLMVNPNQYQYRLPRCSREKKKRTNSPKDIEKVTVRKNGRKALGIPVLRPEIQRGNYIITSDFIFVCIENLMVKGISIITSMAANME